MVDLSLDELPIGMANRRLGVVSGVFNALRPLLTAALPMKLRVSAYRDDFASNNGRHIVFGNVPKKGLSIRAVMDRQVLPEAWAIVSSLGTDRPESKWCVKVVVGSLSFYSDSRYDNGSPSGRWMSTNQKEVYEIGSGMTYGQAEISVKEIKNMDHPADILYAIPSDKIRENGMINFVCALMQMGYIDFENLTPSQPRQMNGVRKGGRLILPYHHAL